MVLTDRQQAAVARAPPKQKAALRRMYERQQKSNRQQVPRAPPPAPKRASRAQPGPKYKKAATCLNFMDPMCPLPVPTTVSAGKALSHTALASHSFSVPTNRSAILLALQSPGTSTVGYHALLDSNGLLVPGSEQLYDMPTLTTGAQSGGCTASRAMRLSCAVVNTTNAVNRGGAVTYINSAQRFPQITNNFFFGNIVDAIRESPYRKVTSGDLLLGTVDNPNKLTAYPTDMPLYNSFSEHEGNVGADAFLRRLATYLIYNGDSYAALPRCMSIIAWVFDPPPVENTYRVTIRSSFYTRWPLESVPGYHMKPIPTVDAATYNRVVDHAEEHANTLTTATEGGLIALAGPKIAQGASYVGRAALSVIRDMSAGGYALGGTGSLTGAEAAASALELM